MTNGFILPLNNVGIGDIDRVGGKNASLGEMLQHLVPLGIRVPGGFVITVDAYNAFITYNKLDQQVQDLVAVMNPDDL